MFKTLMTKIKIFVWKNKNRWVFNKVGDVLFIEIPIYNMPPQKAEEYIKTILGNLLPYKKELGCEFLYVTGYRND